MDRLLIVPAAGPGSRLGSPLPKLLHPINERPMIDYLIDLHAPFVGSFAIVVHPTARPQVDQWRETRTEAIELFEQSRATGMMDAMLVPRARVRELAPRRVWATWCDQIAVNPETVAALAERSRHTEAGLVFPTIWKRAPYIHLERDQTGAIVRVLQRREADAMPEVGENDLGLFSLSPRVYLELLPEYARSVAAGSVTGERNFLPFVPWLARIGWVETFPGRDAIESIGINTPDELRAVSAHLLARAR